MKTKKMTSVVLCVFMLLTVLGAPTAVFAGTAHMLPYPKDETGETAFYSKPDLSTDKVFGGDFAANQEGLGGLNIETANADGTAEDVKPVLETKDGALLLTRLEEKNGNHNGFRLYFNTDKALIEGKSMAIRLTVERQSADQRYVLNMMAGNGPTNNWVGGPIQIDLNGSKLSGRYNSNTLTEVRNDMDITGPITYTLFYNYEADTVSAYAEFEKDGKQELLVIANGEGKCWEQKHVAGVYFYGIDTPAGWLKISNMEFFEAEKGMLDRVWEGMTSEALLGISTGKLSKDVQLPSVAPAAPDIPLSWSLEKENFDAAYIDENNVLKVNVSDVKNGGTNKLIATAAIPGGGAMTKKYSIGVPYRSEPYCASEEDMIYQENFDGKTNLSQIKGVVETAGEQGNVFLSDGKLHVKHTNSSIAEDSVSIYFRDDKGGTLGRIVLEYEVTKTNATHVSLQTVGPNNNPFLGVWNMNHYGADQTKYYTSGGTLGDWSRQEKTLSNLYFRENGPYKVTQYFDTANRKWSMWINGINVLDNIWNGQSGGVLGVAKLSVMLLSSFSMDQEVSIDNVKLYNATLAPKKAADEDTAIVKAAGWDGIKGENASQTALTAPLQFSGTLLNKNTSVVFTEPKGCINADGTINQPLYDTPTTVTANVASPTLSEGDYKGSNMKYNVTVQGKTSVGAVEYDDPAAGANSAICKIYSRTGETRDVTFVLAAYQGDQLVAIDIQPFTIAAEDPDGDANYAYAEVELAEADQNTRLRAFLFEDWESLIPAPVSLG